MNMTEIKYVENFVNVLTDNAEQAGIPIKPLETWQAHDLSEYSRNYHYKGAQISGALKKISRLASESNQIIPTHNVDMSGLYSTEASAASEDPTPLAAYKVTLIEALHSSRRHLPWLKQKLDGWSSVLVTNTRVLGGFPVTSYPSFCRRAVQDALTTSLHWVRTLIS